MSQIQLIPKEIQSIIPRYDGDDKLLNLFISKCEYVIKSFRGDNNPTQQAYLYHCVTSRLVGKAAILVSERGNIKTFEELKEVFVQHFGDPRSEACISIELDNLKIKHGESYIDFCHRIQNVKSSLISKNNQIFKPTFKPNFVPNINNNRFNQQPQGFRPNLHQPFKPNFNRPFNGPPQQFPRALNNYKQSGFFKPNPNQQFRFGINTNQQHKPHSTSHTDVTMRTVQNNMLNEQEADYEFRQDYDDTVIDEFNMEEDTQFTNEYSSEEIDANFQIEASPIPQPK
ncbi:unnamed protein product [Arctia plantaginis]|uniref:Cytadhesion n=1 Tax=Arctia plantaginis TaxID=874455 RepID=A0A8S0YQU9_ARCPL|nr:unnamed protein product [Arctia plantaginis]